MPQTSHSSVQSFHSRSKSLDNLSNALDLGEFVLQLVNLSQDIVETCYLGIGHFNSIPCSVVLLGSSILSLLVQLIVVSKYSSYTPQPSTTTTTTTCKLTDVQRACIEYINLSK